MEQEERTRQKLQIERAQSEKRIKDLEELVFKFQLNETRVRVSSLTDRSTSEEFSFQTEKDRHARDELLEDLKTKNSDLEEKLRNLQRAQTKNESHLTDYDEKLKREIEVSPSSFSRSVLFHCLSQRSLHL